MGAPSPDPNIPSDPNTVLAAGPFIEANTIYVAADINLYDNKITDTNLLKAIEDDLTSKINSNTLDLASKIVIFQNLVTTATRPSTSVNYYHMAIRLSDRFFTKLNSATQKLDVNSRQHAFAEQKTFIKKILQNTGQEVPSVTTPNTAMLNKTSQAFLESYYRNMPLDLFQTMGLTLLFEGSADSGLMIDAYKKQFNDPSSIIANNKTMIATMILKQALDSNIQTDNIQAKELLTSIYLAVAPLLVNESHTELSRLFTDCFNKNLITSYLFENVNSITDANELENIKNRLTTIFKNPHTSNKDKQEHIRMLIFYTMRSNTSAQFLNMATELIGTFLENAAPDDIDFYTSKTASSSLINLFQASRDIYPSPTLQCDQIITAIKLPYYRKIAVDPNTQIPSLFTVSPADPMTVPFMMREVFKELFKDPLALAENKTMIATKILKQALDSDIQPDNIQAKELLTSIYQAMTPILSDNSDPELNKLFKQYFEKKLITQVGTPSAPELPTQGQSPWTPNARTPPTSWDS